MQVIEQPNQKLSDIEARAASRIKAKIIHVLSIYPKLMPSMLQVGIGPSISPELWRPILDMLISENIIDRQEVGTTTPQGRYGHSVILSLTPLGLSIAAQSNTTNDANSSGETQKGDGKAATTLDSVAVSREVGLG